MYTIFVRKSRYTTKQKGKKRMRRNWKKALCGILTGFMLATAAPAAVPELISATEVQAAINVATPAMSSIKISGRNKIIFSWKQVKGVTGYRVYRKTGNSGWKTVKNITGSKNVTLTDTKVSTGVSYTYTVRAYRKSGKNTIWSRYNEKGLTAIAGLNYLTLNKTSLTLASKKTYTLKIKGTSLKPSWKSSNTNVVKITSVGKITAVKTGTAVITATLGGRKFTCKVTVKNPTSANTRLTQNYSKLKKYISQKGKYTEDGNQFINVKVDKESTLMIGYLKKEDKIDIGMMLSMPSDGILAGLDIIGNCVKSDTVSVKSALSTNEVFLLVTSSTKASAYKGQNLTFLYTNGKKAMTDLQDSSNIMMKATMKVANDYLKKNLNLTMKDLGFTAYK